MAQKTIKDYFPSKKKEERVKSVTTKRPLESFTIPRSKRRRVTNSKLRVLTSRQKDEETAVSKVLCNPKVSRSSNPFTSVAISSQEPNSTVPAGAICRNGAKTLSTASPVRRGAECVRLALKKVSSPVKKHEEEKPSTASGARRNLFSLDGTGRSEMTAGGNKMCSEELSKLAEKAVDKFDVKIPSASPVANKHQGSPMLKRFTSLEYDSPTKSDKCKANIKSLAEPLPPPADLPLPKHYGLLAQKFHCTDTIVNMFQRRGEICTFVKLKLAVQQMNGKAFGTSDLARIKTVYPAALLFAQQNSIPGAYGRDVYNGYQLTVECNIKELGGDDEREPSKVAGRLPCLTSSVLLRRRQRFKGSLVTILKRHHKEFLASLRPPLSVPDDKIVRWHPSFVLDNVTEIEESPLPQPPSAHTCSTAKDVLDMVQSSMAPRLQLALETVATSSTASALPEIISPSPAIERALKGISQSLVDKIKQKESLRAKATMTRNHDTEKKLSMLTALPNMCRIIKNLFLADKKAAIPVEEITNKLMDANGSSPAVAEAHLSLMEEVLPQWIKKVTVRKICYVKIDRKMDTKSILDRIEQKSKELSS